MQAQSLSMRTRKERIRILHQIERETNTDSACLDVQTITRWLATLETAVTRETYYSVLAAWSKWLVLNGHRSDDPTVFVQRPRVPRRLPRPVHTKHLERLLQTGIHPQTRTKILLMMYAGLRRSEVAGFGGPKVYLDLVANRLHVEGKGGVHAVLPLHPVIAAEAEAYPQRGYWFPSPVDSSRPIRAGTVTSVIGQAFASIGVHGTPHMIRHWFASTLLAEGVDVRVVQELMRHQSLGTTAIYTKVPLEMKRNAIMRLPTYLAAAIESSLAEPFTRGSAIHSLAY
ncbi:Site-specific recombinase XerD [Micrococcales bacterium KH10]|nr:Site-specific recombinase XerD [Micrococcales bacterium KH10]